MSALMAPGAEPNKWYVAVGRGNLVECLVGTKSGRPFKSEDSAVRAARRMERATNYDAVAIPVSDELTRSV